MVIAKYPGIAELPTENIMQEEEHLVRPYEHCLPRKVHMSGADEIDRWWDLLQVTSAKLAYAPDTIGRSSGPTRACGSISLLQGA